MPGLYVHIPFCVQKCPYCDFTSFVSYDKVTHKSYIDALIREAELRRESVAHLSFDTIYIGGGTPSTVSPDLIEKVVSALRGMFTFRDEAVVEASIEANPESASLQWMRRICESGINRISIGVQSLSDQALSVLKRPHDASTALKAVGNAIMAGFSSISLDLMFGIPGQGARDLESSLSEATGAGVHHISCYELTVEQGTALWNAVAAGRVTMPGEDELAEQTGMVEEMLGSAGFLQYEISNFSLPGHECRHNLNYWDNGEYLGIGCSAVSFVNGRRSQNSANLKEYLESVSEGRGAEVFSEKLHQEASFRESMVLALRTIRGACRRRLSERYGIDPLKFYGNELHELERAGFLELEGDYIRLTLSGRRIANTIMSRLV